MLNIICEEIYKQKKSNTVLTKLLILSQNNTIETTAGKRSFSSQAALLDQDMQS